MATVHFTSHLQKFADAGAVEASGRTVGEALRAALAENDLLRSYVLDDQGRLRRHVAVYAGGKMIADRIGLSDPIDEAAEVYVMQALSGG